MSESRKDKCNTCGEKAHDLRIEEALNCVPSSDVLQFGDYKIGKSYRKALYEKFPLYTAEEIVGSFLGYNPYFPSQDEWLVSDDDD